MPIIMTTLLVGIFTWYGPGFYDQPLACDTCYTEYAFNQGMPPFIAVDPSLFATGWQCGDLVKITFDDGQQLDAYILDTGPLSRYYIEDHGPDVPIIADISEYAWPYDLGIRSATGQMQNVSLEQRIGVAAGIQ